MKVRRAEIQDASMITQINVATWKDAYKGLLDDSVLDARNVDEKRIAGWQDNIQNKDLIVLVCEDEEIMGYLAAGPARDDFGIENEIYAFYVKPSAQRKGVGTKLISEYKKIICHKSFYLFMLKNNHKAGHFYVKNGGRICEKFNRDLKIGEHTISEACYVFFNIKR